MLLRFWLRCRPIGADIPRDNVRKVVQHVTCVCTDKVLSFQVQKMHDAQEVVPSEERSAKRRKTSPEVAAVKKKPAITRSMWCVPVLNLTPWLHVVIGRAIACHCMPAPHSSSGLFVVVFFSRSHASAGSHGRGLAVMCQQLRKQACWLRRALHSHLWRGR